jgi:O-methyltransferase
MKGKLNSLLWKNWPWLAAKRQAFGNNVILDNAEFMNAYIQLISEERILLSVREMYNIYYHVLRCKELDGDMAEVGVFRGGSAKLIRMFKGKARLLLFDTFVGMPATDKTKDEHGLGDFSETSLEQVQAYVGDGPDLEYRKGFFPGTVDDSVAARKFSFVNLDVDIYQSTLDGLNFFYPRLTEGGVIISHDYSSNFCGGVRAAFDLFCQENNIVAIPLWDTQCLILKAPIPHRITARTAAH